MNRLKHTAIILCTLALILITCPGSVGSEEVDFLPDKLACLHLSSQFMNKVANREVKEGFELIRPYFPIPHEELDELINQTQTQLWSSPPTLGTVKDYNFIREETVENILVRYTFVIRHEFTVTRWIFIYYQPETGWLLTSMNWDDQLEKLFIDQAK